jgi:hypothetical protein
VKSGGDFADILAKGQPEIWESHRPAQSGEAGQMFERIVRRALEMRGGKESDRAAPAPASGSRARAVKRAVPARRTPRTSTSSPGRAAAQPRGIAQSKAGTRKAAGTGGNIASRARSTVRKKR